MTRGRQTRKLTPSQIGRLETFRRARHEGAPSGYSLPQLRSAMGIGCSWETLQKALQGLPVWDLHHASIVQWIDRFVPVPEIRDGKAAAAGEREEESEGVSGEESPERNDAEETNGAARTVRGSR